MKLSPINISEQPHFVTDPAWIVFDKDRRQCPAEMYTRPLTDTEAIAVEVATIRESTRHRRWPREVVATFLSAEVDGRNRREVR
ncbi:MAG: hypothetical protein H0T92_08005 [Pyrinomonadaceae bacterium]|nr:hypothetical protein [Pyrinomonadaceae bacterium]